MKKRFILIFLPLAALWLSTRLFPANLTGTSSLVYQNAHYVFRNFNNATGFVRLNNGFTILAGQSATLDTFMTVSSGMDLRTTGSLALLSDLYFGTNITFSSGGRINARNNTIHLGTKTTLQQDSVWQIISNAIIDGHGNTLIFEPHVQLLLESNVSVTLKNMYIQTTRNSPNIPIIRCFDQKGHVTLDNVTFDLADDFPFRTGRMFFYNDVRFTGTMDFIYQSVMQSYVAPQSLLTFDPGTTLYYYPSSTNQDLIQLQDKSSGIYLKGSATTLQTTHTGMRLTKGRLWMDNKVTLSTRAATTLDLVTQTTRANYGFVLSVDWSPNRKFLAIARKVFGGFFYSSEFRVYKFDGTNLTTVSTVSLPVLSSTLAPSWILKWSPDGRYIAIAGGNFLVGNFFGIYSFDGTTVTFNSQATLNTNPGSINYLAWSPNGKHFALCYQQGFPNTLEIYQFNGAAAPTYITGYYYQGTGVSYSASWSPDGTHLAVGAIHGSAGG
ncbi:hypothetical protein K2X40_04120 [Candidatus Babeliales bacterium]|nr:hypothetical protein [Candidatus Babeliales bacterium]